VLNSSNLSDTSVGMILSVMPPVGEE
jgi:hypothetical protein